jgi:hypothetical protein
MTYQENDDVKLAIYQYGLTNRITVDYTHLLFSNSNNYKRSDFNYIFLIRSDDGTWYICGYGNDYTISGNSYIAKGSMGFHPIIRTRLINVIYELRKFNLKELLK